MIKKYLSLFGLVVIMASSCHNSDNKEVSSVNHTGLDSISFSTTYEEEKISLYTIGNDKIQVELTNYGARMVSLNVKDREGEFVDVILGYDTAEEYIAKNDNYYGAIVGRYGNRIGNASFTLNGSTYDLEKNDNGNSLHGGTNGLYHKVWKVASATPTSITFSYLSPDGEAGYPGNVTIMVTYSVNDEGGLEIAYEGDTDKETVLNLTSHGYFNLNGAGDSTILDHELWIDADKVTEVNKTLIPTGKSIVVKGTAFDFTTSKTIGQDVDKEDVQLEYGSGYDHNFELNKQAGFVEVAKLYAPKTGIEMSILTTEPGLQFYSGNFMSDKDPKGKGGKVYPFRSALCLETQHFPDAPNHSNFASTVLKPGDKYTTKTEYRFSNK